MKNFRLFAASLIASAVVTLAPAQRSDDFAALRAKAEKGNGIAQYNLGLAYAEGRGVATDPLEAYVWLSLARENGARGRALDNLIASLDKASLETARQRLAEHRGSTDKIPVVTTTQAEPEIVTTIKTSAVPVAENPALEQQIAALTADKKQLSEEVAKAWKEIEVLNAALTKAESGKSNAVTPTLDQKTKELQTATAELENAGKFNRELEANLVRATNQKVILEQNLATVQTELTRTKAELAEQVRQAENLAALEASRISPEAELAGLREQLAAAQTALKDSAATKAALSAAQTQAGTLTADLATARATETQLRDSLTQLEQEKSRLSAAPVYPDLSTKVGELEAQLARANRNLESSTQAASAASKQSAADLSASAAQIVRLQSALTAQSTAPSYPDLSGKVRELEATAAASAQKLAQAGNAQTELQKQLAAATASLQTERERTQKLLADSGNQLRETTATASRVKELETQTSALQASLTSAQAQVATLQKSVAAKSDSPAYPDLSSKVRELEGSLQTATKSKDEAVQLRRERDELASRATKVAAENTELRTDRERIQKLLADSGKQLRETSATASRVKELETQASALQASLTSAQAQIATLQKSVAAKSDSPAYPDLSGKVRELESRLAATNQQADSAVQTAVAASKQSAADLTTAAAQIAQLQAALAAKPATASAPDLSDRVRELESQLASASTEATRTKQEIIALTRAKDEASRNRDPVYPNLAGRVVELQTALTDARRDLADTQAALRTAEQANAASPVATAAVAETTEPTELQKQLAETENKLTTALRGYAMLQRDHDAQIENATKSAEAVTLERDSLATKLAALSSEVEQLKSGASSQTLAAQAEAARASESLAALQRSTAQNATDLAAARALLQQMQGANTVLANENYQLKTRLSPGTTPAPAKSSVTPVAAPVATTRTHVVASGDTLFRISQRYYGTPNRWQEIYQANTAKLGTNGVLRIGAELVIP